ncbi:galanin receptor type 2-like [Petromyzon marinus]|uniref:galanin receptor type 2-like n=1 Tax=Petromyzon marinus TaxID=7757 RepID=UPI003F71EEA8
MEGTKMAIASDVSTSAPATHTAAASGGTAVASASSSWSGVAIPILDAAILVSGVLGHALVVVILSCKRRKGLSGSRTDMLLLSLSIADLTQLACLPFNSASIVLHEWIFGAALCKLLSFLATACTSASVFTLTVLSLNRSVPPPHPAPRSPLPCCAVLFGSSPEWNDASKRGQLILTCYLCAE